MNIYMEGEREWEEHTYFLPFSDIINPVLQTSVITKQRRILPTEQAIHLSPNLDYYLTRWVYINVSISQRNKKLDKKDRERGKGQGNKITHASLSLQLSVPALLILHPLLNFHLSLPPIVLKLISVFACQTLVFVPFSCPKFSILFRVTCDALNMFQNRTFPSSTCFNVHLVGSKAGGRDK